MASESQTPKGTQYTGGLNFLCLISINSPTRCAHRGIIYFVIYLKYEYLYVKKWKTSVVYFDQRLGAAHSKRWSKSSFSAFLQQIQSQLYKQLLRLGKLLN